MSRSAADIGLEPTRQQRIEKLMAFMRSLERLREAARHVGDG